MTRDIYIVGDFTHEKPFMVVEYFRNPETKYVRHKILGHFDTKEDAESYLQTLNGD